ncbi:MAG: hypothetical protein SOZ00_07745 [Tidjanibacter sp.]|nr:hypothetical protein [Tidjanibacter sp.]
MKHIRLIAAAIAAMMTAAACTTTPDATYVSFGSSTYSFNEDAGECKISLYEAHTPYYFPITVDVRASVESGSLAIDKMIAFNEPDFTVTVDGKYLLLSGIEITLDNSTSIPFTILDNDNLNTSTHKILFEIVAVHGSERGTTKSTVVTIVDNEYAPRIKTGYYKATYTPLTGSTHSGAGEFNFLLTKIGKYDYLIEGLFGNDLYPPRPRLKGVYLPITQTLTFDGTDYDQEQADEDGKEDSHTAFGVKYFALSTVFDKVLVFEGSGANGTSPIVFKVDKLALMNEICELKTAQSGCSFAIYNYTPPTDSKADITTGTRGSKAGVWDGFETAEFSYIGTSLPSSTKTAKSSSQPIPFK